MKKEAINIVYLSLGSNLGDRYKNINDAISLLSAHKEVTIISTSPLIETKPVGMTDQPLFINTVIKLTTTLTPLALLKTCKKIETQLKRIRTFKWGPRTIDIDILLFNDIKMNTPELTIPHPEINNRYFVKKPLRHLLDTTKYKLDPT